MIDSISDDLARCVNVLRELADHLTGAMLELTDETRLKEVTLEQIQAIDAVCDAVERSESFDMNQEQWEIMQGRLGCLEDSFADLREFAAEMECRILGSVEQRLNNARVVF